MAIIDLLQLMAISRENNIKKQSKRYAEFLS